MNGKHHHDAKAADARTPIEIAKAARAAGNPVAFGRELAEADHAACHAADRAEMAAYQADHNKGRFEVWVVVAEGRMERLARRESRYSANAVARKYRKDGRRAVVLQADKD